MEENKNNVDDRLWEFIDGQSSIEEASAIEKLIETNKQWKEKYRELLELHQLVQSSALEEPSLRFTKNVMEEIAKYQIAPAAKAYINNKIIWGIGIFFITLFVGFLIYGFGQVDWNAGGNDKLPIDISKVDYGKFFNNTYVNVFMMINVVLGLMLLDRYLAAKRKNYRKKLDDFIIRSGKSRQYRRGFFFPLITHH
jgi:magnesium-transporting ATPase (P-type)